MLKSGLNGSHQPSATTLPCLITMKLWNSVLFVAVQSGNIIFTFEDIPSASGTLRGILVSEGTSVQEIHIKQRIITAKINYVTMFFIY
jgi:hypothetical protein